MPTQIVDSQFLQVYTQEMEKECDCGVSFAEHLRCVECWILLHTEKKYCEIFNSTELVGFTQNNIRCWTCIPGSNIKISQETTTTQAQNDAKVLKRQQSLMERRVYQSEWKRKKYATNKAYRDEETRKKRDRYRKLNEQFLDKGL